MNFVNIKIVMPFINWILVAVAIFFFTEAQAIEIDFSRRQVEFQKVENLDRLPASEAESPLTQVLDNTSVAQDIVIMNTETGFVPQNLKLKKGGTYRIHIVNVNKNQKNISFVLDAFSEQHNTLFGQTRSFKITPKVDGTFSYQCPETSEQGRLVIYSDSGDRKPASE